MLGFKFKLTGHRKEFRQAKFSYKDSCIYEYDGVLTILIDNTKFFEDEIAILEFFRDLIKWINSPRKSKNMLYNCIETEDNPLISFTCENGKWFICSPWQLFACKISFSREELENAILKLKNDVEMQLNISIPES